MTNPNYEYLLGPEKRHLDIVGSAIILSCGLGVFSVATALSMFDTWPNGPIFRQKRVGQSEREITVYKLRTIQIGNEEVPEDTPGSTFHPGATKLGALLRRSGLDEFPQLLNVAKGEMSLVGPRAIPTSEIDRLSGLNQSIFNDWYELYTHTKPGITGPGQIFRKHRPSTDLAWTEAMVMDIKYAEQATLKKDIEMILSTPSRILFDKPTDSLVG
jgi:lipopolysaccharide/colanic/teichoic acid biosynthesis glycosyltransferase